MPPHSTPVHGPPRTINLGEHLRVDGGPGNVTDLSLISVIATSSGSTTFNTDKKHKGKSPALISSFRDLNIRSNDKEKEGLVSSLELPSPKSEKA